jgi:hypothetical protein
MNNVLLVLEENSTFGELVSVKPLPAGRTSVVLRLGQLLPLGRSCQVHDETGAILDSVIVHCTQDAGVFVAEVRTVQDATFLARRLEDRE